MTSEMPNIAEKIGFRKSRISERNQALDQITCLACSSKMVVVVGDLLFDRFEFERMNFFLADLLVSVG